MDKVEMFYTYHTQRPLAHGAKIVSLLHEMMTTGCYMPNSSFCVVQGRFISVAALQALWKSHIAPQYLTMNDICNLFFTELKPQCPSEPEWYYNLVVENNSEDNEQGCSREHDNVPSSNPVHDDNLNSQQSTQQQRQ